MPLGFDLTTDALAVTNLIVYGILIFQLVGRRRKRLPRPGSISEAFLALGPALRAALPGLPRGYTWREGIELARSTGVDVDWKKVGTALRTYETLRYGGRLEEPADYAEVVQLAAALHEASGP